jgi:hypothetical protein
MSNCKTTKSTGVVFETYGDYRKHKFCQNIKTAISTCNKNCFIQDSSCIIITSKNNGAGNINIDSNFIILDASGPINLNTGEIPDASGITIIDNSITTDANKLSITNINTFNTDISTSIDIDCHDQLTINSTNVNCNVIDTKILSDTLDIKGITNINIKNNILNIDISSSSTITISGYSYKFDVSGNNIVINDLNASNSYILDGTTNTNACTIL